MKTNRLFIKHFQCFARDFPNRGSPTPANAAQASIALDYCNTEAKMYQSTQKINPLSTQITKTSARKILQMQPLFAAAVLQCRFWIRILCRKRLRTQLASRREGTQLSRKVNEMPPSFLKLNSPFRTPFRTFFHFRIGCSSYAFGPFCGFELKTHQIQPDFALSHRFQALKDDAEPKTARFRHKKKNIFKSPI